MSASVGAQEGEAHTEVPYRAGFYGDLRKAVTRSGSFSGPNQRITTKKDMCSGPPTSLPSLLNPTSMAGHRQPIKPGLGGYLHTLGCSEKVSEHAPIPPCSLHKLLFIILLCLSFLPSFTLFHLLPCLYPSFASSFHGPHPVSSSHNGACRNYSFCRSSLTKFPMPLAHLPSFILRIWCCYDNEMCSITMTMPCMCLAVCVDEFIWIHAPLHSVQNFKTTNHLLPPYV